jgi:hypothetical protein
MPQLEPGTGITRLTWPICEGSASSDGGPNAPVNPDPARVSNRRQGGMATNARGVAPALDDAVSGCETAWLSLFWEGSRAGAQ